MPIQGREDSLAGQRRTTGSDRPKTGPSDSPPGFPVAAVPQHRDALGLTAGNQIHSPTIAVRGRRSSTGFLRRNDLSPLETVGTLSAYSLRDRRTGYLRRSKNNHVVESSKRGVA
jgi:hypothetical protein